jgi:hypothetical protein
MSTSDQTIVRRVLASLLKQLEEGTPTGDFKHAPPVVLIMMSQPDQGSEESRPSEMISHISCQTGTEASAQHPGLNKFSLEEESSRGRAPRPCFMEPDRPCVNSGACEMLGY